MALRRSILLLSLTAVAALTLPSTRCAARCATPAMKAGDKDAKDDNKPKITLDGLLQVMSMGAGAPMLGDLKKTNFDKPESEGGAALQFELEANNFDLNSRGSFFDSGWTGDEAGEEGPGFFENLMSGGKLQREYDERMRKRRK